MNNPFSTKAICAALLCACAPAWMGLDGLDTPATAQSECKREWLAGAPIPGLDREAIAATIVPANRSRSGREELYVVGFFDVAGGVFAHGVAMWDGFEWHALGTGVAHPDRIEVREVAALQNGDVVIAGKFTSAGGTPAPGLARWNGQTWHAMTQTPISGVNSLVPLPDGTLLVFGAFTSIDGVEAFGVAHWTGSAWEGLGGGVTSSTGLAATIMDARLCNDGRVAVCGRFDRAGNAAIATVAFLDPASATWSTIGVGVPSMRVANAIATMADGSVVVAGSTQDDPYFSGVRMIQRWAPASDAWAEIPLDPGLESGVVRSIHTDSQGGILIAGYYLLRKSDSASGVFRYDGSSWQHVGSNVYSMTECLASSDSAGLLVCGGVGDGIRKLAGGEWRRLKESEIALPWQMREAPDGTVYAIGARGDYDTKFEMGLFRYRNGWEPLSTGFNDEPRTLTILGSGEVIVAGDFTKVDDVDVPGVARFDGTAWHPVGTSLPGSVNDLIELRDGTIVAAISSGFDPVNVLPSVYRLDGNSWIPIGEPFRTTQYSGAGWVGHLVEMPNGDLVAGGYFKYVGNIAATSVARWDGVAWHALADGLGEIYYSPPSVASLAVTRNGELIAGGYFRVSGGPTKRNVARLRPGSQTWEPLPGIDFLDNDPNVNELCVTPDDDLVITGGLYNVSNQQMNTIMRWRRATATVEPLGTGLVSISSSSLLARRNGDLFVCGKLAAAGNQVTSNFAIWGCRCVADADADGLITFEDFDAFVAAFERGDASADLDGNGFVDIEDFDAFIGVFEHGCP